VLFAELNPVARLAEMFSRFAYYFDEVARRGSIRKAAEVLHIAPSAIDRQILHAEELIGAPLFERLPQGLRPTAVGELLIYSLRRWRRDYDVVRAQIDDMKGLRRGEIAVALVEGAMEFASGELVRFHEAYPGITYKLRVAGSNSVVDLVRAGEVDLGLTFNPPDVHSLRVERTIIFQLGAVMAPGHPLADQDELSLADCAQHALIIPDESISLRSIFDSVWSRSVGEPPAHAIAANSISLMKSLVRRNLGIAMLTRLDVLDEIQNGLLKFIPLTDKAVPLSVLSLISASDRSLSPPAALLVQSLARGMLMVDAPQIG
jgi:DNA-binding transcriptional LysR family regulator